MVDEAALALMRIALYQCVVLVLMLIQKKVALVMKEMTGKRCIFSHPFHRHNLGICCYCCIGNTAA